jgi:hypothetical protein
MVRVLLAVKPGPPKTPLPLLLVTENVVVVVAPAAFKVPSLSLMESVMVIVDPAVRVPEATCKIE